MEARNPNEKALARKVKEALLEKDPYMIGKVFIKLEETSVIVSGEVSTVLDLNRELASVMKELAPKLTLWNNLKRTRKGSLHVVVDEGQEREAAQSYVRERPQLDNVSTLFMGMLPHELIKHSKRYKKENYNTYRKVEEIISVLDFTAPLILDRNFTVIDGDMRLSIHRERLKAGKTDTKEIPVIVIDTDGVKADFLRMVLNRTPEFQKWNFEEVHEFVDSIPQCQPLLEPLGFFGEKILPTSFFGDTIIRYHIDEFNKQQQMYRQEMGLAAWAEIQRKRIEKEERYRKTSRVQKPAAGMKSLFDMKPEAEDFLETYDAAEEMQAVLDANKADAEVITNNYDIKRRAEKEARGQQWQTSRRGSKQVAKDAREAAKKNARTAAKAKRVRKTPDA